MVVKHKDTLNDTSKHGKHCVNGWKAGKLQSADAWQHVFDDKYGLLNNRNSSYLGNLCRASQS